MESAFPFLLLPRELRDQIYSLLLFLPPPPAPPSSTTYSEFIDSYRPSKVPAENLTVLRLNRQIHDEAAKVLYSDNIFAIQIAVGDRVAISVRAYDTREVVIPEPGYDPNVDTGLRAFFDAVFESPWEARVGYTCCENKIGRFRDPDDFGGSIRVRWQNTNEETFKIPSPRYAQLVRHIRLDLLDTRLVRQAVADTPEYPVTSVVKQKIPKILLAYLFRLRRALGGGENVNMDINIISGLSEFVKSRTFASEDVKEYYASIGIDADKCHLDEVQCGGDGEEEELFCNPAYVTELIDTAWPLTLGPWKYTIILPQLLHRFQSLVPQILEKCSERVVIQENEMGRYERLKTLSTCEWVLEGGRAKVVMIPVDKLADDYYNDFGVIGPSWHRTEESLRLV
ncbi:hypothetical protein TWF694_004625 [Orbilia ellipsospora]|uniref:Uncharacterized protein n=1 Tax=Orbilia ellipsospora TaxID=2528407 RepID=A0AAV9WY98_9PEZI